MVNRCTGPVAASAAYTACRSPSTAVNGSAGRVTVAVMASVLRTATPPAISNPYRFPPPAAPASRRSRGSRRPSQTEWPQHRGWKPCDAAASPVMASRPGRSAASGRGQAGREVGAERRSKTAPHSRAACRRLATPSLVSTAATWLSTVRTDTTSRSAISALVRPVGEQREDVELAAGQAGRVGPGRGVAAARQPVHPERAQPAPHHPDRGVGAEVLQHPQRLQGRLDLAGVGQLQCPLVRVADARPSARPRPASRRADRPPTAPGRPANP